MFIIPLNPLKPKTPHPQVPRFSNPTFIFSIVPCFMYLHFSSLIRRNSNHFKFHHLIQFIVNGKIVKLYSIHKRYALY